MVFNIWDSKTRSGLKYLDEILDEFPYAITGGFAVQLYAYVNKDKSFSRDTKDIDVIVDENEAERLLDYLNEKNIYYEPEKSKVRNGIRIFYDDGWFSISFDKLPDTEKLKISKNSYVYVESLGSLLVNKFATYLFRNKEKDLFDLMEITKLLRKRGVNMNGLIKAMKRYNVIGDAEKAFWLYLERQGLVTDISNYVDFESEEEKERLLYYLKGKSLIGNYVIR